MKTTIVAVVVALLSGCASSELSVHLSLERKGVVMLSLAHGAQHQEVKSKDIAVYIPNGEKEGAYTFVDRLEEKLEKYRKGH